MLEDVLEKWRRGQTGPLPHLTSLQLLHALIFIDEKAPVGRRILAQELELSDGTVRGLLERLGEQGLTQANSSGTALTKLGKARLKKLLTKISVRKIRFLKECELVPGKSASAIHLFGKYSPGMTGVPQRDEAIKSGAQGSITIGVREGRLVLPPDGRDAAEISPKEDRRLREVFDPSENDLIVIGFAVNRARSLSGALAAALTISES
jgi:hypothetical protein